jgi:hypothetical protein
VRLASSLGVAQLTVPVEFDTTRPDPRGFAAELAVRATKGAMFEVACSFDTPRALCAVDFLLVGGDSAGGGAAGGAAEGGTDRGRDKKDKKDKKKNDASGSRALAESQRLLRQRFRSILREAFGHIEDDP